MVFYSMEILVGRAAGSVGVECWLLSGSGGPQPSPGSHELTGVSSVLLFFWCILSSSLEQIR